MNALPHAHRHANAPDDQEPFVEPVDPHAYHVPTPFGVRVAPSPGTPPQLTATRLTVGYRGAPILPPVDFSIAPGEVWALVGRNGSGKSTMLRTVLGLLPRIGGRIARAPGARLAYVPQRGDYDLSVPGRVLDFVRAGADHRWSFLRPRLLSRAYDEAVAAALRDAEAESLIHEPFAQLSEGQKQRVLVARALVAQPTLLVLDEPTSAMDPLAERAIFELIAALCRRRDLAVLVASHQMSFVPEFASHVLLVDRERDHVEVGPTRQVLESEAFQARYGALDLPECAC